MFWELKICRFSLSKSCRVLLLGFKHGIAVGVFKRACLGDRCTTQLNRSQQSAVEPGHGWCHRNRLKESCEHYEIHEFLHFHGFQYVSIIFHMSPYISRKPYIYFMGEKHGFQRFQMFPVDFPSIFQCPAVELRQRRSRSLHRHGLNHRWYDQEPYMTYLLSDKPISYDIIFRYNHIIIYNHI